MRPGPSAPVSSSDTVRLNVQELHVAGVLLDEEAPRLDCVSHQRREDLVGGRLLLDLDLDQQALGGIHGRLPELLGVHLAEALEPRDLDALLRGVEDTGTEIAEALRDLSFLADGDRERRRADLRDELLV